MAALQPETEDEARLGRGEAGFDALHHLHVRLYACNLFLC